MILSQKNIEEIAVAVIRDFQKSVFGSEADDPMCIRDRNIRLRKYGMIHTDLLTKKCRKLLARMKQKPYMKNYIDVYKRQVMQSNH